MEKKLDALKTGKLRTYSSFKNCLKVEQYLFDIKDREIRKCFTRFRISAHQLEIEKGRYKGIDAEKRLCKFCNRNEVEDEVHFLLKCPLFDKERKQFLNKIYTKNKNVQHLSENNLFNWLMICEDSAVFNELAEFVFKCTEIRQKALLN